MCSVIQFHIFSFQFAKFARDLKLGEDSEDPNRQPKQKEVTTSTANNPSKEPTKITDKDTKKNPSQLADMRSQLFTKSTGEKVSSKMPKPRSAYKATPVEDKQDPPGKSPVTSGRGLEEELPVSPPDEPPVSHEEPPVSREEPSVSPPEEPKEEAKDDQIPETIVREGEEEGGEEEEGDKMEGNQDDDEDEPLDFN